MRDSCNSFFTMKLTCALLFAVISNISCQISDKKENIYDLKEAPRLFREFQKHYKKNYTVIERKHKYKVFLDNLVRINALNQNLPGAWFAVIGPYTDLTYMEFIKLNKLTKDDYTNVGSNFRNVVNCTDRRGYLFERFSDKVRDDYEASHNAKPSEEYYYESNENNATGTVYYDSNENITRTDNDRT